MSKIKLEKSPSYVFFTSEYMYIVSEKNSIQISFKQQNILNISEDVLALLLKNKLQELNLEPDKVIIVLTEDYFTIIKVLNSSYKKDNVKIKQENTCKKSIISIKNNNKQISEFTEYIYKSKRFKDYNILPLLEEFYVSNSKMIIEDQRYMLLSIALNKVEISPICYMQLTDLLSGFVSDSNPDNDKMLVSIYNDSTNISTYRGIYISDGKKIQKGMEYIVGQVSDTFNVSQSTAIKLIELYGFVFLPAKYSNVVIDIPVYDEISISVEMTELSFVLREAFKELFTELLDKIAYDHTEYISIQSDITIPGVNDLLELMTEAKVNEISFSHIKYELLLRSNQLVIDEVNKLSEIVAETDLESEMNDEPHGIKEKLNDIFNMRIKPWLLDAEA